MRSSTVNIRIHLDGADAAERIRARSGAGAASGSERELAESLRRVVPALAGGGTGRSGGLFDARGATALGLIGRAFDGIGDSIGRLIPRLKGFGTVLRQVVSDLLKLTTRSLLGNVLGGSGGAIGGRAGGIAANLIGGFLRPGGAAAGALALGGGTAAAGLGAGLFAGGGGIMAGHEAMHAAVLSGSGAGGGGLMGSMGALFTNPWTAVVAGGIVASILLWKHFSNRTEKKLREAVQSTYGVQIKDMAVLKQIKEVGEQAFGRGQVSKHLLDTVKLDGAKSIIQGYAESTGQTASKLVTEAQLKDPGWAGNQMIRREFGGPVRAGVPYIVGERRPEVFVPDQSGFIHPNVPSGKIPPKGGATNGGVPAVLVAAVVGVIQELKEEIAKLKAMSPGDVVAMGASQNPVAVSDGATAGWAKSTRSRNDLAKSHGI